MIPINVDVNATKNDFTDGLLVTSIFYTLQGEGRFTGQRFIFIRLAGCNFGAKTQTCVQCDTAFQIANADRAVRIYLSGRTLFFAVTDRLRVGNGRFLAVLLLLRQGHQILFGDSV